MSQKEGGLAEDESKGLQFCSLAQGSRSGPRSRSVCIHARPSWFGSICAVHPQGEIHGRLGRRVRTFLPAAVSGSLYCMSHTRCLSLSVGSKRKCPPNHDQLQVVQSYVIEVPEDETCRKKRRILVDPPPVMTEDGLYLQVGRTSASWLSELAFGTRTVQKQCANSTSLPVLELRKAIDEYRLETQGPKKRTGRSGEGGTADSGGVRHKRGRTELSGGWTGGGVDKVIPAQVFRADGSPLTVNAKNCKKDLWVEFTVENIKWLVGRLQSEVQLKGAKPLRDERDDAEDSRCVFVEAHISYDLNKKLYKARKHTSDSNGKRCFRTFPVMKSKACTLSPDEFFRLKNEALEAARSWVKGDVETPPRRKGGLGKSRSSSFQDSAQTSPESAGDSQARAVRMQDADDYGDM